MEPDERLNGVAVFVEVARAGSFTQAAYRLGLTKSAVGKSVQRMEARLGAQPLYRTTRGFNQTDDRVLVCVTRGPVMDEVGMQHLDTRQIQPRVNLRPFDQYKLAVSRSNIIAFAFPGDFRPSLLRYASSAG
jgi:hypothetical protein